MSSSVSQTSRRERIERVLPWMVALLLLGVWQALVVVLKVPAFLVPSPWRIAETLIADAGLLFRALWVTLEITLYAFLASVVLGSVISPMPFCCR